MRGTPSHSVKIQVEGIKRFVAAGAVVPMISNQVRIHEPFYAPHRVSLNLFTERLGATTHAGIQSARWKGRIRRNALFRQAFETVGRPTLELLRRDTRTLNRPGGLVLMALCVAEVQSPRVAAQPFQRWAPDRLKDSPKQSVAPNPALPPG